jgi:cell division protein FtsB
VIPWKLAGSALGALLVVGAVWAAYSYVTRLSDDLASTQRALQAEMIARASADALATSLRDQHDAMATRLRELDARNAAVRTEISTIRSQIQALDLRRLVTENPDEAARRLNGLARDADRLLDRAAGTGGAGGSAP